MQEYYIEKLVKLLKKYNHTLSFFFIIWNEFKIGIGQLEMLKYKLSSLSQSSIKAKLKVTVY